MNPQIKQTLIFFYLAQHFALILAVLRRQATWSFICLRNDRKRSVHPHTLLVRIYDIPIDASSLSGDSNDLPAFLSMVQDDQFPFWDDQPVRSTT